ncbi:hypothetical protein [Ekhidna sp.]|uniref:hypothetical protein n=1 Tax=Ekhidna sp. TaxID=2608089 RepID=UPI003BABA2D1
MIRYSFMLLLMVLSCCNIVCAQELNETTELKRKLRTIKDFYQNITAGSGIWVNKLSDFDQNDPKTFSQFILKFKLQDSVSVRGQILGVTNSNDSIVFWDFWEFADLNGGFTRQVQRSPSGHYGIGNATYSESNWRSEEINFNYSNGEKGRHRSTHKMTNKNMMISISENFDDEQQKWIKSAPSKWIRAK